MSIWREVQETLYARWAEGWGEATPYCFGNETFDPPNQRWARFSVVAAPAAQETLGRKGNRKFDRRARVFIQLFEPPGNGVGDMSDAAKAAGDIFEACSFEPHNIRFDVADIGQESETDQGRWWGVVVEAPFAYEEVK